MSDRTVLRPEGLVDPAEPYSQAISVSGGKLLFVAGQVSVDAQGQTVGAGDLAAQMDQVFGNLGRALRGAGAGFEDVSKFTTFLVRPEDVPAFARKRREIFAGIYPNGCYPTNTLVVVQQLPNTDWLLEIEAIAALR